ncbi:GNAT family N-acetyltransferase [Microbulbifer spongiae]|uniref:GNAT family N-acetyltransferase n=1 Tax=Microbulbifer spongiae TaxID=2944933 RepID=A0ABY9E9A6_9GAMM|nr:GNAT family N-acetyltransferase [Microbulbifer sp. MI-G]WKD49605.1 GNAT family N-acetyltransferase [Microbulbifer sp. MI-G]
MEIKVDDLTDPRIADFLEEHISDMKSVSPPESKHALDLDALKEPDITFWSVWQQGDLIGCGAIKELDKTHGEIKSMRTCSSKRGSGIGASLLKHILDEAALRGYERVSLETGSMPFFDPARKLYSKFGFNFCQPFADYKLDANSVFMELKLPNA